MRAAPCLTLLLATPISALLKPVAPESAMGDLIATTFMPIIGVLLSNGLYFSGLPAVYRAQKTGTLGDLNVLPLAIMSLSTTSWLAYALSVPNIFIVLSNLPGVIVAMSYTVLTLPLIKTAPERRQVQFVMIAGATVIPILWCIIIFARLDNARRSFTLGAFASFLCIILFASPLSTISEVISSRNSVSIYAPLTAAQVTNCGTWAVYGIAINDPWVWVPNLAGLILGLLQLALKLVYPSKEDKTKKRLFDGSDAEDAVP